MNLLAAAVLSLGVQDEAPGLGDRDTLTGDFWAARPWLEERGVTWVLAYTVEVLSNVSGGLARGTEAAGLLDWVIDADFEPMLGWPGGSARLNPMWIHGEGVTNSLAGDLFRASNIDARGVVRVFEAWLQQTFLDGAVSFRVGILASDQEFAIVDAALLCVNSAFGALPTLSLNEAAPVYPLGSLGARLRAEFGAGLSAQAAVYEGSPGDEYLNATGLNVQLNDAEGVLVLAEFGWTRETGLLRAGIFHHTGSTGGHHTGVYGIAQQSLYPGGPTAFLRAGLAEEAKSTVEWSLETGIVWRGLIPGRTADDLLVAFAYGRLSPVFAAGQPVPSDWAFEAVVEVSYRLVVFPWMVLQPDVQFIRHPGGARAVRDAWVLGLRLDLTL